MDQLLVVSFSRESTRELRERVRERLVSARDSILGPADPGDEVLTQLHGRRRRRAHRRRRRLEEALSAFDAATVTTTHGFCQEMLLALGTAGDLDPDALLVEDISDLVREVADDLYLRRGDVPTPGRRRSRSPSSASSPRGRQGPHLPAAPRRRPTDGDPVCGRASPQAYRRRSRSASGASTSSTSTTCRCGSPACSPTRSPVGPRSAGCVTAIASCWSTSSRTPTRCSGRSCAGPSTAARRWCSSATPSRPSTASAAPTSSPTSTRSHRRRRSTLPTSYRADAGLLDGLAAVFRGAALGDPRIRVLPVTSVHPGRLVTVADHHRAGTASGAAPRMACRCSRVIATGVARPAIAADLTAEVVAMLSGGATVHPREGGADRPLHPGDIAVLVRTNPEAQVVSSHLQAAGVPVVVTGRTSVFSHRGGRGVAAVARTPSSNRTARRGSAGWR